MSLAHWKVRAAGAVHSERVVTFAQLIEQISDGYWLEEDEVLTPGSMAWVAIGEHELTQDHLPLRAWISPRASEEADPDLTPMIDVTFQLIIFFMIVATYTVQKTIDVPESQPDSNVAAVKTLDELEQENILLKVAADGSIHLQGQTVPIEELSATLKHAIANQQAAELILDVSDDATHDVVVKVLDAAGSAQIEKVLFVSRIPKKTE